MYAAGKCQEHLPDELAAGALARGTLVPIRQLAAAFQDLAEDVAMPQAGSIVGFEVRRSIQLSYGRTLKRKELQKQLLFRWHLVAVMVAVRDWNPLKPPPRFANNRCKVSIPLSHLQSGNTPTIC